MLRQSVEMVERRYFTAINRGNVAVISFVLELGLDVELNDNEDYTALHGAALRGNLKGCTILLEPGAIVNRKNSKTGYIPFTLVLSDRVGTFYQ